MLEEALYSVVQSYGPFGLLIVMIIQTIIAPIPSEALLIFSGAIGMKVFDVVFFGGLGLIIGSVLAFYIARIGGKPLVKKLLGEEWTLRVDRWVEKNGAKAIFFTRLIPIIPFDLISYMAGVTRLSFKAYLLATVLGAFPRSLLLAVAGASVKEILTFIGVGLELIFIGGVVGFLILAYCERKGYLNMVAKKVLKKLNVHSGS
jgi:uncharacterized membrane protein YdjX (TVP38/TMEM64 family)